MEKYKVYYNDGVNEMAKLGEFDALQQAYEFIQSEIKEKELVNGCSEEVFSSAKVAHYELYIGEPIVGGEMKDYIYSSPYFYAY